MGCNDFFFCPFQRVFECLKFKSCCCSSTFYSFWMTNIYFGEGDVRFCFLTKNLLVDTNVKTDHNQHVFPCCLPFFSDKKTCFFESVNHINQPINQTISPPKRNRKNQFHPLVWYSPIISHQFHPNQPTISFWSFFFKVSSVSATPRSVANSTLPRCG